MMASQRGRAELLKNLHIKYNPLILFNIWDAGSAIAIKATGAKAIATSSWSVAASHGYEDGENLPFDLVLTNLKRIIKNIDLPVSVDLESGYGKSLTEIQRYIREIIEAGVVGVNFEDQIIGGDNLYSIEDQCTRIKAIRLIAEQMEIPLFINARTDIFLKADVESHNDHHLEESLFRAFAYAKAGADGFFVPGLQNLNTIEKLCELSPLPINIMLLSDTPSIKQLAALGVARISFGPSPYLQMMDALKEAGRKVY